MVSKKKAKEPALRTVPCSRCGGQGHKQYVSGAYLKAERLDAKVTMMALAEAMGVSTSFVSMLESNERPCSEPMYERWGAALRRLKK